MARARVRPATHRGGSGSAQRGSSSRWANRWAAGVVCSGRDAPTREGKRKRREGKRREERGREGTAREEGGREEEKGREEKGRQGKRGEDKGRERGSVEGCGRPRKGVDGGGRRWKAAEGCGRLWRAVEGAAPCSMTALRHARRATNCSNDSSGSPSRRGPQKSSSWVAACMSSSFFVAALCTCACKGHVAACKGRARTRASGLEMRSPEMRGALQRRVW